MNKLDGRRQKLEIRRIEGIIPLEGVSRHLPQKLENFSFHDMKRLLSTISEGTSKKGMEEETGSVLIKATFEGFTPEGKAKLKSGSLLLLADVKVNREFKIGEELFFELKKTYPHITLRLLPEKELLNKLLEELKSLIYRFSPEKLQEIPVILKKHKDTLKEEFKKLGISQALPEILNFSPEKTKNLTSILFTILILLDSVEKREKKYEKKKIEDIINNLLVAIGIQITKDISIYPFSINETFRGSIIIEWQEEPKKIFVEVTTPVGKVEILLKAVGKNLSIEILPPNEKIGRLLNENQNSLKRSLNELGFKIVFFSAMPKPENWETEKKKLLLKLTSGVINLSA